VIFFLFSHKTTLNLGKTAFAPASVSVLTLSFSKEGFSENYIRGGLIKNLSSATTNLEEKKKRGG
jgi:hypothetical protein